MLKQLAAVSLFVAIFFSSNLAFALELNEREIDRIFAAEIGNIKDIENYMDSIQRVMVMRPSTLRQMTPDYDNYFNSNDSQIRAEIYAYQLRKHPDVLEVSVSDGFDSVTFYDNRHNITLGILFDRF